MDLHERFDEWLTAGAEGDPPRDLALHASSCAACLRSVAALDSIQAIEIGDAPLPPLRMVAESTDRLQRVLRYAAGAAAVLVLGTSVAIGAPALFRSADPEVSSPAQTTGEGVLAGLPSERATSQPATQTVTPSPTDTSSPSASERPSGAPDATVFPTTRAPIPQPPVTPRPTAAPPTPAPTPAPSATPIVTPSPSPTASPSPTISISPEPTASTPDDCADTLDNDGDGFVDGLDPGCILSGNEADG